MYFEKKLIASHLPVCGIPQALGSELFVVIHELVHSIHWFCDSRLQVAAEYMQLLNVGWMTTPSLDPAQQRTSRLSSASVLTQNLASNWIYACGRSQNFE